MSGPNRILATGAAATVAFSLLMGAQTVAVADPGGRGEQSSHSGGRGDSGNRGSGNGADSGRGEARDQRTGRPQQSRGRESAAGSERRVTGDAGTSGKRAAAAEGSRVAVADASVSNSSGSAAAEGAAEADRSRGSDRGPWVAPPAVEAIARPEPVSEDRRVREPAAPQRPLTALSEPLPAETPPLPPAVVAPTVPTAAQDAALRVAQLDLSVLRMPPGPRPGQPMTSLFGLLGLLLIPLAGAALGYRQARAARAVRLLTRP